MKSKGFTLIELLVVMALISIVMFFTIPKIHDAILFDQTKKVSRWLIGTIKGLKEKSLKLKQNFILNINIDDNRMWVTNDTMSEEQLEEAAQKPYVLPDDIELVDILFPGQDKVSTGIVQILFYSKGYSDKAFIHLRQNNEEYLSFLIEPFLSQIKTFDRYVSFES